MAKIFKKIEVEELKDNVFKLLDEDWMLITAGNKQSFNTMTASWGGFGVLWNKSVSYIVVRPTRYTYEFTEKFDNYTLCVFDAQYRKILNYCGSKSGREVDKAKISGLIPIETETENIYFEQARLVMECRKLYYQDLDPKQFINPDIQRNYPKFDYHRMYIGEITSCLVSES